MSERKEEGYPSADQPWLKYYDPGFLDQPLPHMPLLDYMKHCVQDASLPAVTYYGRKISYAQLYEHIDQASRVLSGIGVKENTRVLYLMPNIPETIYLFYGGSQIGAVADYMDPRPDSIDPRVSAQKIANMAQSEKVTYIVTIPYLLPLMHLAEDDLRRIGIRHIVLVSPAASMDMRAAWRYMCENIAFHGPGAALKKLQAARSADRKAAQMTRSAVIPISHYGRLLSVHQHTAFTPIPYRQGRLETIVHTSGTTSAMPKPIPLSNDNMNAYVHITIGANLGLRPGDRSLHILPCFAAYGLVNTLHDALCKSYHLISVPEFSPEHLGKMMLRHRPQLVLGTPSWYIGLLKDPAMRKCDLGFLRMITYGGDSMAAEDEERVNAFLKERGSPVPLTKGHGMSETSGGGSYARGDYNAPGSIGIPLPHTIYALVDPQTKEMLPFRAGEDYIEGELIISSPTVTGGMLDGQTIVERHNYDGHSYIMTGDIARMDRNGAMTFLQRNDRTFTRFDGYKIKPYEIEKQFRELTGMACVVAPYMEKARHGFMPIAHLVAPGKAALPRAEQAALVRKVIEQVFFNNPFVSSRQIPARYRLRDDLPLTVNAKVDYRAIAAEPLAAEDIILHLEETNLFLGKWSLE